MDSSIWSHLPNHLIDLIISFLPLPTILSLRPTSKHFNSLLHSPFFLSLLPSPSPPPFLLLSHPQFSPLSLPLFHPSRNSWRSLPLSHPHPLLSSVSSGLLLFNLRSSLLVSNLLTHSSTTIPLPALRENNKISSQQTSHPSSELNLPQKPSFLLTLISSPSASLHGYKIFLAVDLAAFVYDSRTRKWTHFRYSHRVSCHNQDGVLFQGLLYFATAEPFSVVSFDVQTGEWDSSAVPALPAELAFVRLVGDGGKRLFLVGGVGRDGISRSLKVWELVKEERRWEEVGRLPEMMCRKFVSVCYHNYGHVQCLWHDGMICICCTTWPEVLFYKVGRRSWHWLPRCPMLPEKWSCGFRWFSFVPDLFALV